MVLPVIFYFSETTLAFIIIFKSELILSFCKGWRHELIRDYDKIQFIELLELCKTRRLNDAEKSIVNNIYEFLV